MSPVNVIISCLAVVVLAQANGELIYTKKTTMTAHLTYARFSQQLFRRKVA